MRVSCNQRRIGGIGCLLVVGGLLSFTAHPAEAQPACAVLERVSVASDGVQGDSDSGDSPGLSADGRFAVFGSAATNLVAGDTNGKADVFVHDRQTGVTERVSVASDGTQANFGCHNASLSVDGRYVCFWSISSTLVAGDTNARADAFVHDRQSGTTELASVATSGAQANSDALSPHMSGNGRYVAFYSRADNLVPDDTNGFMDVFVHDRQTGVTERVSVASDGTESNDDSQLPHLSSDGRFVAFASAATNLVAGDTNGVEDVFVHDRQTGTTERLSVASDGTQGNGWSHPTDLSADGRYVSFHSIATNLAVGNATGLVQVYVRDRQTGTTEPVSVATDGTFANAYSAGGQLSGDGRFVAFSSDGSNLVSGDSNGVRDIFVRDRVIGVTQRVTRSSDGTQADAISAGSRISGNGRVLSFISNATNLVAGDTNAAGDAFVADNCLAAPVITWVAPPPATAVGGVDSIPLSWELANFGGTITENQAHFGIASVLGSSPVQAGTNAVHGHTFAAPNVGAFDAPETYGYIIRALNDGTQVLSTPAATTVTLGPTPPTVTWVVQPPSSAVGGGQFRVEWQLSNYVDPAVENAAGWGITSLLGQSTDQPGGNGTYAAAIDVPPVTQPGVVSYTAFARNPIEFAFAPVVPVTLLPGPPPPVVLTPAPVSPGTVGLPTVFSAVGGPGVGPHEYAFFLRGPGTGDTWAQQQAYGVGNSWTWIPGPGDVGTSRILVWVRTIGATVAYEAFVEIPPPYYTVVPAP